MAPMRILRLPYASTRKESPGSRSVVEASSSITAGPSDDGNLRISSATVSCSSGDSTGVRTGDAYWDFELEPGAVAVTL